MKIIKKIVILIALVLLFTIAGFYLHYYLLKILLLWNIPIVTTSVTQLFLWSMLNGALFATFLMSVIIVANVLDKTTRFFTGVLFALVAGLTIGYMRLYELSQTILKMKDVPVMISLDVLPIHYFWLPMIAITLVLYFIFRRYEKSSSVALRN